MRLAIVLLVASAGFAQSTTMPVTSGTVDVCKYEGDSNCVTVLGHTMLKTYTGPLTITDNWREIARIDSDGKVTIADGVTAEYVIRMMAQHWQEQAKAMKDSCTEQVDALVNMNLRLLRENLDGISCKIGAKKHE